ncbi:hypothetical protein Vadar_015727 [Vaccinium darrowii]|uniref:Uncharacterized protein n=1 Tax=Vaccinium darrowii TaxID=229202 RepID=A0ACB7XRS3_9ERIC|nr:hypothetical protein Vadar_015727 [Vaccinium darrowii]
MSRNMRTYATAWVHPKRKLSTSVDSQGNNNPTWNDKFVFRVDEEFLRTDTSAVMIEIYAVHWMRDTLVGTVRVLVGNLVPPPTRPHHPNHHHFGMRFVALQVRRPSGRPQGILNIGVAVLDSSMRSMPLYTQLSASAVGYRDLMDDDYLNNQGNHGSTNHSTNITNVKPILRRSKSERSERVTFDSISTATKGKASSALSASESTVNPSKGKGKKGKASSVISGAELREKPKERSKKGKASSVLGSITSKDSIKPNAKSENPNSDPPKEKPKLIEPKTKTKHVDEKNPTKEVPTTTVIGKPISKFNGYEFGGPKGSSIVNGKYIYGGPVPAKAHSIWSDSEVGPSPSEVAAVMARERHPIDDNQSSVLDGWSLDESVEGLRSKLERWRTELPPLYDRSGFGSSSYRSTSQHLRRHSDDGGMGLFSCFGNIYGYECQCICGKPPDGRRSLSNRFQSPSASAGRSFL